MVKTDYEKFIKEFTNNNWQQLFHDIKYYQIIIEGVVLYEDWQRKIL